MRWGAAALLVACAFLLRPKVFALPQMPMLFFLPAIMLWAMFLGRATGVAATGMSAAVAAWFFLPPVRSLTVASANAALSLALFAGTGLFITAVAGALRSACAEAEEMRLRAEAESARAEAGAGACMGCCWSSSATA